MAKAKKMADGGLADYLQLSPAKSGGNGGGAFGGLEAVNQGAGQIGQSLNEIGNSTDAVKAALGNGGGGSAPSSPSYLSPAIRPQRPTSGEPLDPLTLLKKGGSVKKQLKSGRISTAHKNSKSPNW
jgi:hypothetical protein